MSVDAQPDASRRIVTVPNLVSAARLLFLPVFLWLLFARDSRAGAAVLLGALGATDWVDGYLARRLGQVSELGKVLDPTADRIMLGVAVIALGVDGSVPGAVFWPVVVREAGISIAVLVLAAIGASRIEVLWVGKAGTFALMVAFPLFLLAEGVSGTSGPWRALAWVWAVPGIALSYYAALEYTRRVPHAVRRRAS